jgi:hypothetical protein
MEVVVISLEARKLAQVRSIVVLDPLLDRKVGESFSETRRKPLFPHRETRDLADLCT